MGLIQYFTKECDDKFVVRVAGTDKPRSKAVRGPSVGVPDEVRIVVELRERIGITREYFETGSVYALGTFRSSNDIPGTSGIVSGIWAEMWGGD
jgi:hypothetical protein